MTTGTTWTYDALQRLTQEAYTSSAANENYTDVFTFDLASNRMSSTHTGPGGGPDETIDYQYNGDDQLTIQTSSLSGETDNDYDPNGSLTTSTTGGVTTTYTYDARNKMVGYSSGSMVAAYTYDDAGNRVQETVNGTTTYYLTDTQNPTGYAQPVEQKASPTAAPSVTYFLGTRAYAQADGTGTVAYLLIDGHGSTEQLVSTVGTVIGAFRYNGFGTPLNFSASTAGTMFLFGGDAVYDPASGTYFHGDGVRETNGFLFMQRDVGGIYANNQDPLSLHAYLYADANPINGSDPTGHSDEIPPTGEPLADVLGQAANDVQENLEAWENEGGALGEAGIFASEVTAQSEETAVLAESLGSGSEAEIEAATEGAVSDPAKLPWGGEAGARGFIATLRQTLAFARMLGDKDLAVQIAQQLERVELLIQQQYPNLF